MVLSQKNPPAGPGRAGSEFDFVDILLATAALRAAGIKSDSFKKHFGPKKNLKNGTFAIESAGRAGPGRFGPVRSSMF